MRVIGVGELKAQFSEILKKVVADEEIGISYGKKKVVVAKLMPKNNGKKPNRKLGIFEDRGTVKFNPNFKMTEEEFLGT